MPPMERGHRVQPGGGIAVQKGLVRGADGAGGEMVLEVVADLHALGGGQRAVTRSG